MDFTKWAEPAPFHGAAKQFMTEAYVPAKNETNCEDEVEKVNQTANVANTDCEEHPIKVEHDCGCNETADSNAQNLNINVNAQLTQNGETPVTSQITVTVNNCPQNSTDSTGNESLITPNEIHNNDTVLKYVYKKDEKINIPEKSKGHDKNSISRKKRALNNYSENLRYAASVPIVRYRTAHDPRDTENRFANIIRGSDLADFNIETSHENLKQKKINDPISFQPLNTYNEYEYPRNRKSESIIIQPVKVFNEIQYPRNKNSESIKIKPVKKYSEVQKPRTKNNEPSKIKPVILYDEVQFHPKIEKETKEKFVDDKNEDNNSKKDHRRIRIYQNRDNAEADEEDDDGDGDDDDDEDTDDDEEDGYDYDNDDEDDKKQYNTNKRNNKPHPRNNHNERERSTNKNNNSNRENLSDEKEEYRDNKRYNAPYRKIEKENLNDENEEYHDNKRYKAPYRKTEKENLNDENGEYHNNKRYNAPYRKTDNENLGDGKEELRDNKRYNAPYRKTENNDRDEDIDDRKNSKRHRQQDTESRRVFKDINRSNKPYRENESEEKEYKDDIRNNKSYRRNESNEKEDYRDDRGKKQYTESEINEEENYRDNRRNNKPRIESESEENVDYRDKRRHNKPRTENDSGEKDNFRDNRKHKKTFSENESDEKEDYRDNRKNTKPYIESESDEDNDYTDNRRNQKSNIRNESKEKEEYRNTRRNNKPYTKSNENEEYRNKKSNKKYQEIDDNDREQPIEDRRKNASYKENESDEQEEFRTNRRSKIPFRLHDSNEKEDFHDDIKPYLNIKEQEEFNDRRPYKERESIALQQYQDRYIPSYSKIGEKGERRNYRESKRDLHGDRENSESSEKDYPRSNNEPYSLPQKDNNQSRENLQNEEPNKPLEGSSESHETEKYREDNTRYPQTHPLVADSKENIFPRNIDNVNSRLSENKNVSEEEEEEIIAIMKKKIRKPPVNSHSDYKNEPKDKSTTNFSSPINIQDVDLGDFSYERIKLNDKGLVETAKDTHENYDIDRTIEGTLTTTPESVIVLQELSAQPFENFDSPINSEIIDNKRPIKINDGEVKPVVEINSDSGEASAETSKEALKADDKTEDLETILGVKITDDNFQHDDSIVKPDEEAKGDVKQQFERIPVNYQHNNKADKVEDKPNSNPTENSSQSEDDDTTTHEGTLDVLTPTEQSYDENLNIKFGDLTIKLPEINLPKDILSYAYEDPAYDENRDQDKEKYYQYNDGYSEEIPRDQSNKKDKNDYVAHGYPAYFGEYKRKDDESSEEASEEIKGEDDYDDRGVDLYEKFVRERFGRPAPVEKKSEKLQDAKPLETNNKLLENLQHVIKKTEDIQKEAEKSGDPKAGYMWTLEYGQSL